MSYTSAQSGDNYRNWWPHRVMTAFTNDSIDTLDRLARETGNRFNLTRKGYVLATRRSDISDSGYIPDPDTEVDVYKGAEIRDRFGYLASDIQNVIHIKRAGDLSSQQLGAWMLETIRKKGVRLLRAKLQGVGKNGKFTLDLSGEKQLRADLIVNAAGPFANGIAAMLGERLPTTNVFQQKIAFEDHLGAIPRDMPFSIDLDEKELAWSNDERELLIDDPERQWLTSSLPGGTHCRPEGGSNGRFVKLGWAYNETESEPVDDLVNEPASDPQFPEIVMRAAAAFIPALQDYVDAPPVRFSHYGGYYTMTEENWPLIGPMQTDGAFMATAMSGFGSMAACAAGDLCASWVCNDQRPWYADALSTRRYANNELMDELRNSKSKGLL